MNNESHKETVRPAINLAAVKAVYFVGIGGIGMSALARYFHAKGVSVSGYDKTETALTRQLVKEGIKVHYTDDVSLIAKEADLVVYTPAIPAGHTELAFYKQEGYTVVKRSDVLQAISQSSFNICIGGTHGKTTITCMIAHILRHTGYGCNAFLGGIASNYGTNFWSSANDVCVIEADEYDRSFLKLSPDVAIITAMDADHLDIYGDASSLQDAFIAFGNKTKEGGLVVHKFGLKRIREIQSNQKWAYSLGNDAAQVYATNIKIDEGGYTFNMVMPGGAISDIRLNIGGMHNVENAIAAVAVASYLKIDGTKIKEAVAAFAGVKRRFEYIIPPVQKIDGAYVQPVFIDDYAHHPEELSALLKSVRTLFPQRKITVLFQPHLYTRTRDFKEGFAESLSLADNVVLLPIYPAREQPLEGVTSEMLLPTISVSKQFVDKDEVLDWMKEYVKGIDKEFGEVIVTAGAGDIDALVQPLKTIIEKA